MSSPTLSIHTGKIAEAVKQNCFMSGQTCDILAEYGTAREKPVPTSDNYKVGIAEKKSWTQIRKSYKAPRK